MSKRAALLLIPILALTSLVVFESAFAQSNSIPSVSEFTLQLEDNWWVRVIVQNQPIIPNGHDSAWIFYTARYKWHESSNWYPPESIKNNSKYIDQRGNSDTTEWVISTNSFYELLGTSNSNQLDYQILAINGYKNITYPYGPPIGQEPGDYPVVIVNTSGWSNTQTITISESQTQTPSPATAPPTASPAPTSTPYNEPQQTYPEAIIGVAITAIVIGAGLGLLIYLIKRK